MDEKISELGWKQFISDLLDFIDQVRILNHAVKGVEVKLLFRDGDHFTFIRDIKKD